MNAFTGLFKTCAIAIVAGIILACAIAVPAQDIPLPVIPGATFNITDYGAVGDGRTMNTDAIQKTINAASAAGGGMVLVPAGKFLTKPFTLASSINLHLARDAEILISDNVRGYPASGGKYQDGISASGAHDLEISGEGTIDGQGRTWWAAFRARKTLPPRPCIIKLSNCSRVRVRGVTLNNSPMFHLVTQNCQDVTIQGVTIQAPADSPNTDGIDPSGWNYLIADCTIDVGDDNIAVKPTGSRIPGNKNYTIKNCTFKHGHGCSIGSGTANGIENLTVSSCTFDETDTGIRIKTMRENGGLLQNCTYENLKMTAVKNPICIMDYYPDKIAPKDPSAEQPEPVTDRTPFTQNITIRNVTATNCTMAGTIGGLPEAPITNVKLFNVNISAKAGMNIYFARKILFVESKISAAVGRPLTTFDAEVLGLD